MGTKTVYVKNEDLWETAKSVAGPAGLSGFVEEALELLITAKRDERAGLERFDLPVEPIDGTEESPAIKFKERLSFDGRLLANFMGVSIYRTKAGKFIVTDNVQDAEGSIFAYRTYDQLAGVRNDRAITGLGADSQSELWDLISEICESMPLVVFTTWID
jgi:hypothetical protein